MKNAITKAADLIGGDSERLKKALRYLIDDDVPVAPIVEPRALAYAHILLEHYAYCRTMERIPKGAYTKQRTIYIDWRTYSEKVLDVALCLLLVSAGGWEALD